MPPKAKFDRERIIAGALELAREEGLSRLTARGLAQRLGCSTSPIYTAFQTIQELEDVICELSTQIMLDYQTKPRTGSPLMDLCLGYVLFAMEEKQLFRDMFLDKPALSPHSLAMKDMALKRLVEEMVSREPALSGLELSQQLLLLETLWTYAHGLAAQVCVGALDLPDQAAIVTRLGRFIDPLLASLNPRP